MAYSITPMLRKDRVNKKTGEYPIVIRTTIDRRHDYCTIDKIKQEDWNAEKFEVRKSHANYAVLNTRITTEKAKFQRIANEIELYYEGEDKIQEFRRRAKKKTHSGDFFEFVQEFNEDLYVQRPYSTYKRYVSVINKFKAFYNKDILPVGSFKIELIRKFESHLIKELRNTQSTITSNMKVLAFYLRQFYIKHEIDLVKFPFIHYDMKETAFKPTFLEIHEIQDIINIPLTPINSLRDIRIVFLFECYTGIRIGDILRLKWENLNIHTKTLNYITKKTGRETTHPLNDLAFEILDKKLRKHKNIYGVVQKDKYIFNFLKKDITNLGKEESLNAISSATATINRGLKKIAKKANIDKNLSTHVGRHTYATMLVSLGGNTHYVKNLMGHSSIKMTERYVSIVDETQKSTNNLWNNVFNNSDKIKRHGRKRKINRELISNN